MSGLAWVPWALQIALTPPTRDYFDFDFRPVGWLLTIYGIAVVIVTLWLARQLLQHRRRFWWASVGLTAAGVVTSVAELTVDFNPRLLVLAAVFQLLPLGLLLAPATRRWFGPTTAAGAVRIGTLPPVATAIALALTWLIAAGPLLATQGVNPGPVWLQTNRTWTWDGVQFSAQRTRVHPPAREEAAMAYDAQRREVVLFGGCRGQGGIMVSSCSEPLKDTWTWDGVAWAERHPAATPGDSFGLMTYDAKVGRIVFVDRNAEGWSWSGSNWDRAWTTEDAQAPHLGQSHFFDSWRLSIGYDEGRAQLVALVVEDSSTVRSSSASFDVTDDYSIVTSAWDGSTWSTLRTDSVQQVCRNQTCEPAVPPGAAPQGSGLMAYDRLHRSLVNVSTYTSTWSWDGAAWKGYSGAPSADAGIAIYDDKSQRVVYFATSEYHPLVIYAWGGIGWTTLSTVNEPRTEYPAIAYDEAHRVFVLFGGACNPSVDQCSAG